MSQIHSALAYYWDYQTEIDTDIQRRFEHVESLRHQDRQTTIGEQFSGLFSSSGVAIDQCGNQKLALRNHGFREW
jgi:hypothetical protein